MKIIDIFEARRNTDQNPKENIREFLEKYRGQKKYYCHWSAIPKVGINPSTKDSQDSPHGVYATNMFDLKDGSPQYGDLTKGFWFILESDVPYNQEYSEDDFNTDVVKLNKLYGEHTVKSTLSRKHPHSGSNRTPLIDIYVLTRRLSSNGSHVDIKEWARLLRELGFTYIIDHGEGFIHPAEDHQIVFLGDLAECKSQFTVIDMYGFYAPRKVHIAQSDKSSFGDVKEFSETHAKRLKFDSQNAFTNSSFHYDSRFLKTLILNFKVDSQVLSTIFLSMHKNKSKFKVSIKSVRLRNLDWYTHIQSSPAFVESDNVFIQALEFDTVSSEDFGLMKQVKFPKHVGEIIFHNAGMLEVPEGVDHRIEFSEDAADATPSKPSFGDLVDGND